MTTTLDIVEQYVIYIYWLLLGTFGTAVRDLCWWPSHPDLM